MRKLSLFLTALLIAAALTGCKNSPKETEAPTEAPTEAQTEAVTEAPTEAQTEPQTEAEDSMNKTRSLKGLVKTVEGNTLTIQTERGKELQFDTTGADMQVTGGAAAGNNVMVMYKGKIQDTDTAEARVLMVTDLAAGETPVTEGEPMTESAEADPDAGEGTMGGSISDVNADRVVILADDGTSYYFSLYGTDVKLVNGMNADNYVTVRYNGDIHGPALVPALTITDTQENSPESQAISGPSQTGDHTYINGVLEECALGSVTITTDEGETQTYNISEATCSYSNGTIVGNYLTLECEGEGEALKVVAVYDYSSDGSAGAETEAGQTVDDGTTDDGSTDNATTDNGTTDNGTTDDGEAQGSIQQGNTDDTAA